MPKFIQASSLSQLRSTLESRMQSSVAEFLRTRATNLNSRLLHAVAMKVAKDPMKKVKKMIKDLVVKLMEEANQESGHKGWCDTELGTNQQTRDNKAEEVATLTAEIDSLTATIETTTATVKTLTDEIADLDKAMADKTAARNEENAANKVTIADSQAAQTALAQALIVLKEFYAKAATGDAGVKEPVPEVNEKSKMQNTFSGIQQGDEAPGVAEFKGQQGAGDGVVKMLEVIEQDFAHLETTTTSAEDEALKAYEAFMTESKVAKSGKSSSLKFKTEKNAEDAATLKQKKNDLADTQTQLDAALAYFDKLKPSCISSEISYEDRVAQRNEEIASLKEALAIMAESADRDGVSRKGSSGFS